MPVTVANTPRLSSADSLSTSLVGAVGGAWLANVLDLAILAPSQVNCWRWVVGQSRLPIHYGYNLSKAVVNFDRWWLVVAVALSATVLLRLKVEPKMRKRLIVLYAGAITLLCAILYRLYYIPNDSEAAIEVVIRFLAVVIFAAGLTAFPLLFGSFTRRVAERLFA